ncbi:MAG TPA: M50 family metallopeptidase [Longimicrobiales bacterium]|nr:M50 family metallopeptidase [Longimicrobiales bacterium]
MAVEAVLLAAAVALVLGLVTAVHEAGHGLAVRVRGGRVLKVQVGYGTVLWGRRWGETDYVIALFPVGGRIRYEGVAPGTAEAVVAVSGPVANLVFALVVLGLAAWVAGPGDLPYGASGASAAEYALAEVRVWAWLIPRAVRELVATGQTAELGRAMGVLLRLLRSEGAAGFLYVSAAVSTVWAVLNLIPLPVLGTDGWHLVRALLRARPGADRDTGI